ncbi:hypothetical protein OPV22_028421 [Ensete ventricosum]|uniref:3-beta hydroxysteroid dehydrogenase/isomerase domain-containing protein n=1 Tax=Ensete ventricosum TaxID=4639 RepID=A0AAV8Q331_ENSVE|nr:hypothetical protein OPV22_028421 [Ensete ventricosum]
MLGIDDPKNGHLRALDGAKEPLVLAKADLLDVQSLRAAIHGCDGVFHMASPVTDDPEQVIEPAITGTSNVIECCSSTCSSHLLRRVGAVCMNPNRGLHAAVKNTKVSSSSTTNV